MRSKCGMLLLRPLSVRKMARDADAAAELRPVKTRRALKKHRHIISKLRIARGLHFCGQLVSIPHASCFKMHPKSSIYFKDPCGTTRASSVLRTGAKPAVMVPKQKCPNYPQSSPPRHQAARSNAPSPPAPRAAPNRPRASMGPLPRNNTKQHETTQEKH